MLIRFAALAALGYVGYRYLASEQTPPQPTEPAENLVAGGPISSAATLQHSPDAPPA